MKLITTLSFITLSIFCFAQPTIQVNGYGHLEYEFYDLSDEGKFESEFAIGEHDLFLTSKINKKLSFLSEIVVKPDKKSSSGFSASIERARIKYNYFKNHSLLFGKMHTPLNYWNDVYHHGRLFFPTIDRPMNFDYFFPIHTTGIRAQGQNIGNLNFGYDLMLANSLEGSATHHSRLLMSYTASVHIKPTDGMRIMLGYYNDYLPSNGNGSHGEMNMEYDGELTMNQFLFSFARMERKLEILNEFAYTMTNTDSLGASSNFSNYLYVGYRIKDTHTPFVMIDYLQIDPKELHAIRREGIKYSLGYRWDIDPKCNVKFQLENYMPIDLNENVMGISRKFELKIQLAYAL